MNTTTLAHLKILDLTRLFPGPYVTRLLADLGAEIIKFEPPGLSDYMRVLEPMKEGMSVFFDSLNRNKRSLCLDLKKSCGVEELLTLVEQADVVVE